MTIYQHKDTKTAAAGTTSTSTLDIRGGILRHVLVVANTSSTVFRANLVDENSLTVIDWGFSTGMLNDFSIQIPVVNGYTFNITNASPNDTFKILLSVEE